MKTAFCAMLALSVGLLGAAAAHGAGTNVDSVKFIQYLDENTALEEVRNGNLDIYYYRISSDRIEGTQSREGLKVFDSTGGSYSILINPAETGEFNPFFFRDVRFALNYLVDRNLIVNELMGGYGVPMISNYGPFDPEYLTILDQLEEFQFRYNPKLAEQMISDTLLANGAEVEDGQWMFGGSPIKVTVFIRSDDPVRKSIGEILASELEDIGFQVAKDFGDLNKAFVVVYGSDPAENRWSLYTEGWGGRSAFVRYDPLGLAQMYSPWFSNMPGFNDPRYWNYQNEYLDGLTQRIYAGDFASSDQRDELIQEATVEAVGESVRIFLASKIDQYVVNEGVDGIVNDFGAGVPTRFTPINARGDGDQLRIGVKQIYQGAWNPVRGLTDSYSTHIWNPISDPAVFKHPFTGHTIPVRSQWEIKTVGPGQKMDVPGDAVLWNPQLQEWESAGGRQAASKVTFDLEFSNWHNGVPMDMYDVLYSVYFALEWGTAGDEGDRTFDAEYTPQAAQMISTLAGVRPTGDSQIEVYVDYWHFDEAEIADRASVWSSMPWEVFASMEKSVLEGKASFSRSGAVGKNVSWLSLIVPSDSRLIGDNLEAYGREGFVPAPLRGFGLDRSYFETRYGSTAQWIAERDHAVISNGPFYLESYAPEARTVTLASFDDPTYPFGPGHWAGFEETRLPKIVAAGIKSVVPGTEDLEFQVETEDASEIRYFVSNEGGTRSGSARADTGISTIRIAGEHMAGGTNSIRIFAVSEEVMRPDFYSTSFVVSDDHVDLSIGGVDPVHEGPQDWTVAAAAGIAIAAGAGAIAWRRSGR